MPLALGRNKEETETFATEKNNTYRELLKNMSPADLTDEVRDTLNRAAEPGGMTALALFGDAKGCGLEDYNLTSFSDLLNILP